MASQQLKLMNHIYASIKARASYARTILTTKQPLAVMPANIAPPVQRGSA